MQPDCFLHHIFKRRENLPLPETWREGTWSGEGMIYRFLGRERSAETTLSGDSHFSLEWTVKISRYHQHSLLWLSVEFSRMKQRPESFTLSGLNMSIQTNPVRPKLQYDPLRSNCWQRRSLFSLICLRNFKFSECLFITINIGTSALTAMVKSTV